MDAADQEDNDLHPDFRLLLNNSKGPSSQALPSRDAKSSQGPEAALNDQYDAFFQILGEDRRAAERTYSRAVYEPSRGLFRVTLNKGTHFVSMGHTLRGQIYLFPEEALYLVDRGSLLVEHHGSELTVQQMWNIYLTIPLCHSGQIKENGQDNTMVMNRYLAYAYLKRLGFTVIRPGTYNIESESRKYSPTAAQNQLISRSIGYISFVWSIIRKTLAALWINNGSPIASRIGLGLTHLTSFWSTPSSRPLVSNDVCLSYGKTILKYQLQQLIAGTFESSANVTVTQDQILQSLQFVPAIRLVQLSEPSSSKIPQEPRISSRKIDFDVYKPSSPFKKRQPGYPDYRVVVSKANDQLPTVGELGGMMEGQPDPVLQATLSVPLTSQPEKGRKKKNIEWPKVLFAVVDGGQVSFVALSNIKAIP